MFNQKIKEEFLLNQKVGFPEELFNITKQYEQTLNKDIYDFTINELILVFSEMNLRTKDQASSIRKYFNKYINWAMGHDLKIEKINWLAFYHKDWINQFVN